MLRTLQIRDFAIVPVLELEFEPGFTAITGETGAGKSIIVDALGLLAGNRADTGAIRAEADKAELSAEFDISDQHPAAAWLRAAELDEDKHCIIRRVISRSGRSRAWINGRAVTLNQMQDLGRLLIEIHGQNEHIKLTRPAEQFRLLDGTGAYESELESVQQAFAVWQALDQEYDRCKAQSPLDAGEVDLLRYQLDELRADALSDQQLHELEREHHKLSHGAELASVLTSTAESLSADNAGVAAAINQTVSTLQPFAALDTQLTEALALLQEANINVDEANAAISRCSATLDLSPQRLAHLESQLGRLHDLARKHRVGLEDLASIRERLDHRLENAANLDQRLSKLQGEIRQALDSYHHAAAILHRLRCKAADSLGIDVSKRMQSLSMEGGVFCIEVTSDDQAKPSIRGTDRLDVLVSANPGNPPGPLARIASGGELSRISLALKVAVAHRDGDGSQTHATQIFDEVDAGIGGDTANSVGRMLSSLSQNRQSLCVTHLAQVAACAGQQIKVEKATGQTSTAINTTLLAPAARVEEIARMLSGLVSESSLKHARELIGQ